MIAQNLIKFFDYVNNCSEAPLLETLVGTKEMQNRWYFFNFMGLWNFHT